MLAGDIAARGMAIISGLALGVDALAHQAALDAGGYTVAVLANGLDAIHPNTNRNLALRILKSGGAIISEYPKGTPPLKQNFIARNRIVSGLCDGLLITEASERSGSLHTANFALEQGKVVMAVPGNINSNNSRGTNNLIKTGATPITDIDDVLFALKLEPKTSNVAVMPANAEEAAILDHMKKGITDINQLQQTSKLSPELFSQTLTMLEITGKVRPLGAGHWGLN
jgi:DNA processing protein